MTGPRAQRKAVRATGIPTGFVLALRNRQRTRRVDLHALRRMTTWLLRNHFQASRVELCFHLVGAKEMADVNWNFLQHEGSTDVITFDHGFCEPEESAAGILPADQGRTPADKMSAAHWPTPSEQVRTEPASFHGEIYISLDDAVAQAKQFRTTWPSELARYVIHGLLHLAGHDDLQPAARRAMKREENRLLREVTRRFPISRLASSASRHSALRTANSAFK